MVSQETKSRDSCWCVMRKTCFAGKPQCSPAELDPFEQKDTTMGLCPSKRRFFLGCGMFSFPFLKGEFRDVLLGLQFFRWKWKEGLLWVRGKNGSEQRFPLLTPGNPHAPHGKAEFVSFLDVHLPTGGSSYLIIIQILCGNYIQQGFLGQNYID